MTGIISIKIKGHIWKDFVKVNDQGKLLLEQITIKKWAQTIKHLEEVHTQKATQIVQFNTPVYLQIIDDVL